MFAQEDEKISKADHLAQLGVAAEKYEALEKLYN